MPKLWARLCRSRVKHIISNVATKCMNTHFIDEIPALSDDIDGIIGKAVVQFCPKMSLTVWQEYIHDGMLFHGNPKIRSERAWNNWAILQWLTLVVGNNWGVLHSILGCEGWIH